MADGLQDRDGAERRPALVYPMEQSPELGEAIEVAPGRVLDAHAAGRLRWPSSTSGR